MSALELDVARRRGMLALTGREVRRVFAVWTQTILPPVLTALLFLGVFGGALGSRIGSIHGLAYLDFVLPGLLVMTVAVQSFHNNSTSLFQAKSEGYIDDVLTSPMASRQLVLGYMAGGFVRGLITAAVVAAVAAPVAGGVEDPATAAAALVLTALVFSALGVVVGMWADTFDQHAFVANLVVSPLALVAGVFYSAETLSEPWATLTKLDPLYYLVDATRAGFTGFHESDVGISLGVAAAFAAATHATAVALLSRGWRLKP